MGIEAAQIAEDFIGEMIRRVNAASDKEHIGHAAFHQGAVNRFHTFSVEDFHETALFVVHELFQVVPDMVFHGVTGCGFQHIGKCFLLFQNTEAGLQRLHHFMFPFRTHIPDGNRTGMAAMVCIGNVEIIFQSAPAGVLLIKNCNALCSTIDPSAKPFVPALDFQHRRGVGTLGIDQKLIIKGKPVVAAGCGKKCLPLNRVGHFLLGIPVQRRNLVVPFGH